MVLLHSIQSEWLKTKRSAASWLCLLGGFFIPLIHLIIFLKDQSSINHLPDGINAWSLYFMRLWKDMAIFLLPMGLVLASSLITQVEYRNNTWKQLHTTPQSFTTVFLAKFAVVALMTFKFFLFFNIGILLSAGIPSLLFDHSLPHSSLPIGYFLSQNLQYFVACLPIMALQFLISLQFKNFLLPIGIGFLGLVSSLIGMGWKYIVISPYSYCPLKAMSIQSTHTLLLEAGLYFMGLMLLSYWLYIRKKEKG